VPNISVKTVQAPTSPALKKITKEMPRTLENTPDTMAIYWADVKREYPDLEAKLKPFWAGKEKLTVADLKGIIAALPTDETKFWLSQTTWESELQRDIGTKHKQIVVQLNLGQSLLNDIESTPEVSAFFSDIAEMQGNHSLHPTHTQNIAWARVYPMKDKWVIEEIQSDIFGATPKLREMANSSIDQMLEGYTAEQKATIENFFLTHFKDWDKKLLATVISMARKAGVHDVWIFDEQQKEKHLKSNSKLERYYKVVPRDLGFKRDTLQVDARKFTGWHRVVATFQQSVTAKYRVK